MNNFLELLFVNWQETITGGAIVSCSIIMFMGILKSFGFNKIKNKLLRKVILAFLSLALVFPATALYFVGANVSFDHYWFGCAFTAVTTILTYWLYENTCLRELITLIGDKTIGKWLTAIKYAFGGNKSNKVLQTALVMTTEELKEEIKKEIKNQVKKDDDLKYD